MKSVSKVILALILMSNTAMAQVIELGTNEMEVVTSWEDGQALISWETQKEVNTSHFIIEKSSDGLHYEIIETLKAGSSTYRPKNYEIEDAGEVNAYTQYRVSLIAMDGSRLSSITNSDFIAALAEQR